MLDRPVRFQVKPKGALPVVGPLVEEGRLVRVRVVRPETADE
ncbi:hypothetical protein ACIGN6_36375 [Streptomyces sp. NPDC053792]